MSNSASQAASDSVSQSETRSHAPTNRSDASIQVSMNAETAAAFQAFLAQRAKSGAPQSTSRDEVNQPSRGGHSKKAKVPYAPDYQYGRSLKAFLAMKPDSCDGTGEPYKIVYWFSHTERLLRGVKCCEAEKVLIASLQLKEGASEWWESSGLVDLPNLTWAMFKEKMYDRFFSTAMRKEKLKEFLYPQTDGLSVSEIALKFNHLLKYAGPEMASEKQKMEQFHEWMNPQVKPLMVNHACKTLEEYVNLAYKIEVTLEESAKKLKEGSKLVQAKPSGSMFKRPAPSVPFDRFTRQRSQNVFPHNSQASVQQKSRFRCFNCGEEGHGSRECHKPKRTCFQCGKEGHIKNFCHNKEGDPAQSRQGSNHLSARGVSENPKAETLHLAPES